MSGFVDFVVAGEEEHPQVLAAPSPPARWPHAEWKWLMPTELAWVYALLTGRQGKEEYLRLYNEFTVVGMEDVEDPENESGATLYRTPAGFLERLADLSGDALDRAAKDWAALWRQNRWGFWGDESSTRKVLESLHRLASQARAEGKALFIRDAGAY